MAKQKVILSDALIVPGPKGDCPLPQSAARCTRCNACAQNCPAYLLHPQEIFSPRGRIQLIRLLAERKLNIYPDDPVLNDIVKSCILCARCSSSCAAQIPIEHHMLALRRAIGFRDIPAGLRLFMYMHIAFPNGFDKIVRTGLFLRRIGLGVLFKPFMPGWLKHAHAILPKKTGSLGRSFIQQKISAFPEHPQAVYLPSLYAQYADPQAGLLVWQLLKDQNPFVLFGYATGLFEYLYGSRTRCLKAAKKLLRAWEKISAGHDLPLITDSIEVYTFLKNYPSLFGSVAGWKQRAQRFAEQVKFVMDLPFPASKKDLTVHVALDASSVLFPAPAERAREILLEIYGPNLLQCAYSRFPLPAGGSGFVCQKQTNKLVWQQMRDIQQQPLDKIYCLSPWAALELDALLRKHYPDAQAQFIIYAGKEL